MNSEAETWSNMLEEDDEDCRDPHVFPLFLALCFFSFSNFWFEDGIIALVGNVFFTLLFSETGPLGGPFISIFYLLYIGLMLLFHMKAHCC